MKTLLLSAMLLPWTSNQVQEANVSVGSRSEPVRVALEEQLKKRAGEISSADLAKVTDLKLPHIHVKTFKENEFAGLTNLKKLHFFSLFHNRGRKEDPIAIDGKVFKHLAKLEELMMTQDQLGQLPDDVFAGLTSLKILDLTSTTLNRVPSSLFALPKIETVYFDGRGLSKEDHEMLKTKLGDKLRNKRPK